MGLLSNLLKFRDGPPGPVRVRQVTAAEVESAMRLVLSCGGAAAEGRMVEEFVAFARERGIDLGGIHIAQRDGRMVSAILPVHSPGRTMLMLCPSAICSPAMESATRSLVEPICRFSAGHGVHLAQALVDPSDAALHRVLSAEGFGRMAELHYLNVAARSAAAPELPPGLSWTAYSPEAHGLFGRTVLESYKGSLDCPSLNGLREIEDILAGHKASGIFNPSNWLMLMEGGRALGVLLLSASSRGDAMELVYLGIVPEARGRGLGEVMVRQALSVTAGGSHGRLCLAVDSQNTPALKLYYRHGMQRIGSKVAMLRDLRRLGGAGGS